MKKRRHYATFPDSGDTTPKFFCKRSLKKYLTLILKKIDETSVVYGDGRLTLYFDDYNKFMSFLDYEEML